MTLTMTSLRLSTSASARLTAQLCAPSRLALLSSKRQSGSAALGQPVTWPLIQRTNRQVAQHAQPSRFDEAPTEPIPDQQRQISALLMQEMQQKIGEALETQEVRVADAYGDGRHVSIDVVSELFEGKSSVQRQRLVYKAIWLELQNAVHAVDAMTTRTPREATQ